MKKWLRRIRAVIGLGLLWALGGVALGGVIELVDNVLPAAHGFTRLVDMWPQTLAILAFRRGVLFAILLGIAGRRQRIEDFTLAQFALWGAVSGLILGAVAMAGGAGVVFVLVTTLLSALGGAASLALARLAERTGLIGAGATETEPALTEAERRELLGEGHATDATGIGQRAERARRG